MRTLIPVFAKNLHIPLDKDAYKEKQLERSDTWAYARAIMKTKMILNYIPDYHDKVKEAEENINKVVDGLRRKFSLSYSNEVIIEMMNDLVAEFEQDEYDSFDASVKERLETQLNVLEHHDTNPKHWDDCGKGLLKSALFGSIYGITRDMYSEMERRRPGFTVRTHRIIVASAKRQNS